VQIAKHFFDPESVNDQGTEVNLNDEDSEDPEETSEQ